MAVHKTILFLTLVAILATFAIAQSHCKWEGPSGKKYDFSTGRNLSIMDAAKWLTTFSWCNPAPNAECASTDGVSCWLFQDNPTRDPSFFFVFARWSATTRPVIKETTSGLTFTFNNGGGEADKKTPPILDVIVTCGETEKINSASADIKTKSTIDITSPIACHPDNGLSGGAIFLIIIFCLFIAYFLIGFIVLKFVFKKKTIPEAIPHYSFWTSLPGFFVAGVKLLISKVTKRNDSISSDDPSDYGSITVSEYE